MADESEGWAAHDENVRRQSMDIPTGAGHTSQFRLHRYVSGGQRSPPGMSRAAHRKGVVRNRWFATCVSPERAPGGGTGLGTFYFAADRNCLLYVDICCRLSWNPGFELIHADIVDFKHSREFCGLIRVLRLHSAHGQARRKIHGPMRRAGYGTEALFPVNGPNDAVLIPFDCDNMETIGEVGNIIRTGERTFRLLIAPCIRKQGL